ncbi:MAG: hypothetical protein QOG70_281 [Solirubrobacteraceae bacterium]|jgi:hypothetical protein|nr:hypothetical protein [Solirubrobacteraceae bacterium]
MRLIVFRHRVAALAAERVYFAAQIEVLEPDHPDRRFVAALCLYSHAVATGQVGRPYDQRDAERFARALLMPEQSFEPLAGCSDAELAERFTAPLDQVRARREDGAPSLL